MSVIPPPSPPRSAPQSEASSELEAVIAQKEAALEELKADIATLREQVGQKQKRQAAELHRGREQRVETLLAELLPLPDVCRSLRPLSRLRQPGWRLHVQRHRPGP